jgi:hypothetical protein
MRPAAGRAGQADSDHRQRVGAARNTVRKYLLGSAVARRVRTLQLHVYRDMRWVSRSTLERSAAIFLLRRELENSAYQRQAHQEALGEKC